MVSLKRAITRLVTDCVVRVSRGIDVHRTSINVANIGRGGTETRRPPPADCHSTASTVYHDSSARVILGLFGLRCWQIMESSLSKFLYNKSGWLLYLSRSGDRVWPYLFADHETSGLSSIYHTPIVSPYPQLARAFIACPAALMVYFFSYSIHSDEIISSATK